MKKPISTGHEGYSIIAAVMMIGFLLVLTTSTLNLVLQEMQDGKGRQDYLKVHGGAEGSLELALLRIKQEGYGYDDDSFQNQETLGVGNTIPQISYEFESKVTSYSGTLQSYASDIFPLFSIDAAGLLTPTTGLDLSLSPDIVWNIITQDGGVSGIGDFNSLTRVGEKTFNELTEELEYDSSLRVEDILSGQDYLILYNPTSSDINYELSGLNDFTVPRAIISSKARVGKYTQNLETTIDNTEFLGILKYSIYSGN